MKRTKTKYLFPIIFLSILIGLYFFWLNIRHPNWESDIYGSKVKEMCENEYNKIKDRYPEYTKCKLTPHSNSEGLIDIELSK
jgi:hypothetical protein